ncbi:MAG TPA: hypothetical protein VFB66_30495 [Tepidisphaeraceae bacterium]|nr:hypothetical protein [Tepidisphaeraceae bacterium]
MGIGSGKTRDDPAAWYAANRFISWRMLLGGGADCVRRDRAYAPLQSVERGGRDPPQDQRHA